jgi:hypothetical protein
MMKAQQPSANGAKFDMQVQNGTLKVALNIPPAALKKAMTTQRAAIQQAFLKQMPPALAAQFGDLAPAGPEARPLGPPRTVVDQRGNTVSVTLPGSR